MIERFEGGMPSPEGDDKKQFESPESRKVTERTYEQYLEYFCLPEDELRGRNVLDIGAGLSTFAKEANSKFGKTGTMVVAMDPLYSSMNGDFKGFNERVAHANMQLKVVSDRLKTPAQLYREVKSSPYKVAGSHQDLPFRKGSFDLVLASNSVLQYKDRGITERALQQISEVLKPDGEMRLQPADLQWDNQTQSLYIHTFEAPTKETLAEARALGLIIAPDKGVFEIFRKLEETGSTFYSTSRINRSGHPLMGMRGMMKGLVNQVKYSLIMRRDASIPKVDELMQLRKLSFKESPDGYHVPSTEIPLETDESAGPG